MLNRVQCQRKQGFWYGWKGKKREEVGQYKGRPERVLDREEGSHSVGCMKTQNGGDPRGRRMPEGGGK